MGQLLADPSKTTAAVNMPSWMKPDYLSQENASVFDSPLKKGIRGLSHFLGWDDPASQIAGVGGVGGVPEGINPAAIGEMLKRQGLPAIEDAAAPVGKAAKNIGSMAVEGLKASAKRMLDSTSETRLSELYKKLGGLGKP